MTNSINNISKDNSMNDQKLEEVTSFIYSGTTLCKDGTCSAEVRIRIASAMARLNRIWQWNTISFASKFKFCKSLVTSILLYGCETWTLFADSKKRDQAFETKCMRKLFVFPTCCTRPMTGCGARSTSLWIHRNLLCQLSRDGNLHGSGVSHAMTASPKSPFRAPWRVGNAVASRGNAGWTTSKSGHPCM